MKIDRRDMKQLALPIVAGVALFSAVSILHSAKDRGETRPRVLPPGPSIPGTRVVSAIGLVEAETEQIAIGAASSGVVARVDAVAGQYVRAGGLLFSLDARAASAEIVARKADLRAAESRLAETRGAVAGLRAQAAAMEASVEEAEAAVSEAQDIVKMAEGTKIGSTVSLRELDPPAQRGPHCKGARQARLHAHLAQVQAQLAQYVGRDQSGPTLAVAEASVEQARASLAQAETSLDLHNVRAQVDATVLQVNVHPWRICAGGGFGDAADRAPWAPWIVFVSASNWSRRTSRASTPPHPPSPVLAAQAGCVSRCVRCASIRSSCQKAP